MAKYFITLGIFFGACTEDICGQDLPAIQLDRPDQTECPFITPKNYIQVENGFTIEKINALQKIYSYPSALWKYGINEKLEFRLITEMISESNIGKIETGILPISLGFKTSLFEEKGIIPKTSFIGHLTTSNVGSAKFHTQYVAPAFRFTMQNTLTSKISLAYNLGAEWNGITPDPTYIYTLTTGVSLTDKMGCYAEIYGFISNDDQPDHRFDGGFTYLINHNFMADISGGFGLTKNAPKGYLSLGLSYRFKVLK